MTFLKYSISGGLAAIVHLIAFHLLTYFFLTPYLLASAIGFGLAIAVNYPLQYFWTFKANSRHQQAFIKYLLLTCCMLLLNLLLLSVFIKPALIPPIFSQAIVIGMIFIANFSLNKLITFR